MNIECPQCHATQSVDHEELGGQGVEIECNQCGLPFTVRPHGSEKEDSKPEPLPAVMPAENHEGAKGTSDVAHEPPALCFGLPPEAFFQKEEIPSLILQAYENYDRPGARSSGYDGRGTSSQQVGLGMIDDYSISIRDGQPSSVGLDEEAWPGSSVPLEHRRFPKKPRKVGRLRIPLFIVLALAAVALVALSLRKVLPGNPLEVMKKFVGKIASELPFQQKDKGSIQFSDLNSYFVSVGKGQTPAFVIEGKVTNRYSTPCQFVRVKGILFDARGDRAAEEVVYCGNVLRKQEIQASTPENIHETLQTASGSALANINIQPGKSIPFMLVFFNPPENVSEFSVEIFQYQRKNEPEAVGPAAGSEESRP